MSQQHMINLTGYLKLLNYLYLSRTANLVSGSIESILDYKRENSIRKFEIIIALSRLKGEGQQTSFKQIKRAQ